VPVEPGQQLLQYRLIENAERLARFERQAKLLASLNHPNLATVFGVHDDVVSSP